MPAPHRLPHEPELTVIPGVDHVQLEFDFRPPPPAPAPEPDEDDGPIWNSLEDHAAYLAELRRKAAARARARRTAA
ncbi:hypothetical protein Ait01nite_030390 [Actinoplanes italicus]|uniref:Uncharacterized protein n=1 Tax=Actinoplanes italicus TaxID=113567 RepID=A0A2T0KJ04_9ACTN|nr:hypothetical protein [Actinoplanes italicus]PRX23498.1 hypothetical protein CLV67_103246 [Actinoplanes italicus]GIE29994.1 hypothetical protein Ait01nite_030390 [Actinoplanes italicus]